MADGPHRRCCTTTLTVLAHIPAGMRSKITEDGLSFSARTLVYRLVYATLYWVLLGVGSMQNVGRNKKLRALNPKKRVQRPEIIWLNRIGRA